MYSVPNDEAIPSLSPPPFPKLSIRSEVNVEIIKLTKVSIYPHHIFESLI